jgi:outer membrane protein TolC
MLNLIQVRRNAVSEARTNLEVWRRSEEQALLYNQTVIRPALEAQELSAQAYKEGEIDLTVLLLAQRELIQAQRRLLRYQAAATTDLVALELSVGGSFELPLELPKAIEEHDEDEEENS